jgi:formate dehydrogenase
LRSINSWMKNSPKLMIGGRGPTCSIHPEDADELALHDGAMVRITSKAGSVEARVEVTDDVVPGSVCLPHGWGGQVDVAGNRSDVGGPEYNALTSRGATEVEPLAGMSILNGVRVRVEPIRPGDGESASPTDRRVGSQR